jgi:hypothetical protein
VADRERRSGRPRPDPAKFIAQPTAYLQPKAAGGGTGRAGRKDYKSAGEALSREGPLFHNFLMRSPGWTIRKVFVKFLVDYPSMARIDMIAMQKVKPIDKLQSLKIDMDGKVWLRCNVSPFDSIMAVESHFAKSWSYKDLPGYVAFGGVKRIDSPEFAGMPFDAIRDQTELTLFEKNGATGVGFGSVV